MKAETITSAITLGCSQVRTGSRMLEDFSSLFAPVSLADSLGSMKILEWSQTS
jgi:hypothetical protein